MVIQGDSANHHRRHSQYFIVSLSVQGTGIEKFDQRFCPKNSTHRLISASSMCLWTTARMVVGPAIGHRSRRFCLFDDIRWVYNFKIDHIAFRPTHCISLIDECLASLAPARDLPPIARHCSLRRRVRLQRAYRIVSFRHPIFFSVMAAFLSDFGKQSAEPIGAPNPLEKQTLTVP